MQSLLSILILLAVVGVVVSGWWYNSPQQKGKRGETKVHNILSRLPKDYHVFNDIVLKTDKGTTQIDHVVVSKYGIFAIETKNYRGEIYGDDSRQQWTQIIVTKVRYRRKWYKTYTYVTKNKFYNPVKQSLGHIYELKKTLPEWRDVLFVPIVVFTGNAKLSNVNTKSLVIYDNRLISSIQQHSTVYLSASDVQEVINRLTERNIRSEVKDKAHVRNVNAAKSEMNRKLASGICPRCGGTLVLRRGRYGQFYGCSNYPKCEFTTHR